MTTSPTFSQRHIRSIYFAGGLLLGIFVAPIVCHFFDTDDAPLTAAQLETRRAELNRFEARAEGALSAVSSIADADVTLSPAAHPNRWHDVEGTVVLTPAQDSLSADQIQGITGLVASVVEGLDDGHVVLMDDAGYTLNAHWVQEAERKAFWTDVAINVAKVLGILAALLSVKVVLRCVTRGRRPEDA